MHVTQMDVEMETIDLAESNQDRPSDEDVKDGSSDDPNALQLSDVHINQTADERLYRKAARKTYRTIRDALFRTFQDITSEDVRQAWESSPIPPDQQQYETLQLYTSRKGLEDTGFCYWRVCGTLQVVGDHLDLLLSDYWPRTRLSWDPEMESVRVVERFPKCGMMVVQTLRKDAPKDIRAAGGTLGLHWHRYNTTRQTWMILFHSIRQHRHVDPSPPTTCRGMGETWTAVYIRENTQNAAMCNVDVVTKVWSPTPLERRPLGSVRAREEEKLRQRMHLYEDVQRHWFKHFPPGLAYGKTNDPDHK